MLFGAAIFCIGLKVLNDANATKSWPTVKGKVVGSSVETSLGKKRAIIYHANVRYEYVVDGLTQSSTEISSGDYGSSDPSHAQEVVNQYPVGMEVTVHYSPENPAKAVLEPGITRTAYFVIGFGAIFFGLPMTMFIFAPKSLQRSSASLIRSRL